MVVVDSNAYHWVENDGVGRGNCGEAVNFGLLRWYKEWKAKTIEEICSCRDVHNRFHAHEQEKMEEYFKSTKASNCPNPSIHVQSVMDENNAAQDSKSQVSSASAAQCLNDTTTNVTTATLASKLLPNATGFRCTYCGKVFNKKFNLLRHMKVHEDTSAAKCTICCKTMKNQVVLYQHTKRIHGSQCCPSCHYRCKKDQELKSHDYCIRCREEDCSFVTQSKRDFELHQQLHHGL